MGKVETRIMAIIWNKILQSFQMTSASLQSAGQDLNKACMQAFTFDPENGELLLPERQKVLQFSGLDFSFSDQLSREHLCIFAILQTFPRIITFSAFYPPPPPSWHILSQPVHVHELARGVYIINSFKICILFFYSYKRRYFR